MLGRCTRMAHTHLSFVRILVASVLWLACVLSIFWSLPDRFALATGIGGYTLRSMLLFPIYVALAVAHWVGVVLLPLWAAREFYRRRRT
jgi:hypothetical protein